MKVMNKYLELRLKIGCSKREMCRISGVAVNSLRDYEAGIRKPYEYHFILLERLRKLANNGVNKWKMAQVMKKFRGELFHLRPDLKALYRKKQFEIKYQRYTKMMVEELQKM